MKRLLTYTLEWRHGPVAVAGWAGCAKDPVGADGPTGGENRFTLTFAGQTAATLTVDQTETVYAGMRFVAYQSPDKQPGNLSGAGTFSHEVILKRDRNIYTGMMRTGNWGLAAVSPRSDLLPLPGAGADMTETAMYRMPEDATSCPEIFFGSVTLPEIVADQDAKADMSLARNMSQVYVRILDKDDIVDRSKPRHGGTARCAEHRFVGGEHPAGQDESDAARGAHRADDSRHRDVDGFSLDR